ncbi:hypothetical protein MOTT16_08905 [Moraxella osloensis]|uniref:Uncharacterized protein n=1 Tax=Faucicola osloensis TaxID=34062 RepID=A0AAD0EYS9_FAUOS|nr:MULTISPECIES: hypothetical protein [Moraxella]ATQ83932.1 hypothetical protein YHS_08905 [Moraxella osloensis]ATW86424.1 hypothetical protein MOTT16_08905 [Moraxella osloensis]MDI4509363.1 hypothetical protein [Moraxella osloensis]MDK1670295.1 hypothetical protein [Moraxella osloensis]
MNHYKDTAQQPNTLETLKNGQIDTSTKVTFSDVIKSILLAVLMIGLLLLISSYHQAHPKNNLQSVAGVIDNKDLSKLESGQPSRYSLAFFMPNYRLTSQVNDIDSIAPLTHFTGLNRHIYAHSVTNYGEVTSQNKIAFTVNMRGGFFRAKSEPCLPPFWDWQSLLTQQSKGVANHG